MPDSKAQESWGLCQARYLKYISNERKIFEYLSEKYPELIPKGKNLPKHAHLGKSKETGVSFDTII